MTTQTLPALSLRTLRDLILEGDPGCLCDPELFTGPKDVEAEDEPEMDRAARIAVAREVCSSCPVRLACLAYALRTRPASGVWSGFTSEEIGVLADAANRRPVRKNPAPLREPSRLIAATPQSGQVWRPDDSRRGGVMGRHTPDPGKLLESLGAVWSPDLSAYGRGDIGASQIRCVLCSHAPCGCPAFGTPEYVALIDVLHGRNRRGDR